VDRVGAAGRRERGAKETACLAPSCRPDPFLPENSRCRSGGSAISEGARIPCGACPVSPFAQRPCPRRNLRRGDFRSRRLAVSCIRPFSGARRVVP